MEFRILGPVAVMDEGRELPLGRAQQRALLVVLLLHPNEVVPVGRLVDALWGTEPPETARTALQGHVSRLRKLLGAERLVTRGAGYSIVVAPDELDLARFERLVADARAAHDPGDRVEHLRDALALWRGSPLTELRERSWVQAEAARLEELRLAALEDRLEAELALGRHRDVAAELEQLVARHPLRDRLRGLLMIALYRAGRQAEALEAYRQGRRVLAEELGLDPSPALQKLEQQILTQDPSLELDRVAVPDVERPAAPRRARPALLLPIGAGVLAAAVAIPVFALSSGSGGGRAPSTAANDVIAIDPKTNDVSAAVPVGARPRDAALGFGSLWVANLDDRTVSRLDLRTGRVVRTIPTLPLGTPPAGLAAGAGAVWYVGRRPDGAVVVGRIDPRFNLVADTKVVGPGSSAGGEPNIALSGRAAWVVSGGVGPVVRIDLVRRRVVGTVDTRTCCPSAVATGAGALWVADPYADTITRFDEPNLATPIPVGHGPGDLAATANGVWATLTADDTVVRIDPATNAVRTTIPVGASPAGIAVGAGGVWVAYSRDGTVSRIDPRTNKVVATIAVGGSPERVVVGTGRVWVTLQQRPAVDVVARAGGVVRANAEHDPGTLDPALAYTSFEEALLAGAALPWQIEYATCAKLLNYPDRPAPLGSQVVPEVAESLPTRSTDGRTYTFTIRKGFRFSPPSNQPVTAVTFKYAIERSLSPRMHGPASLAAVASGLGARATLDDVVGARAYAAGEADHISGIVAAGRMLRIELVRPAPDLLDRLALPFFCAVPTDTPLDPSGVRAVPSAGPYYVASYSPGREIVLKRNPNYGGGRPHHLEEIRIAIGLSRGTSVQDIEAGRADYALDGVPLDAVARLKARYGGRRYFAEPSLALFFIALNTSRPLFAGAAARKAVNYAIDRAGLIRLAAAYFPTLPTDQYLPPGMRGFRDVRVYPPTPDLATARRLAGGRRTTATLYTLTSSLPIALLVQAYLKPIGIDTEIKTFSLAELRARLGTRGEPFDLAIDGWSADYPDPAAMLVPLLDGRSLRATGNTNISYFADAGAERRFAAAAALQGAARSVAYGNLDVELARDAAPLVAVGNPARQDFFSARIGCHVYQPVYGTDLAALCLRR